MWVTTVIHPCSALKIFSSSFEENNCYKPWNLSVMLFRINIKMQFITSLTIYHIVFYLTRRLVLSLKLIVSSFLAKTNSSSNCRIAGRDLKYDPGRFHLLLYSLQLYRGDEWSHNLAQSNDLLKKIKILFYQLNSSDKILIYYSSLWQKLI